MDNEVNNELRGMGSYLHEHRNNPFQVPEGYFDSFSDRIANAAAQQNDEVAVAGLPRIDIPWQVPSGYFDSFPERVKAQVLLQKKKGILISFTSLRWAAAAMLVVMIGAAASYRIFDAQIKPAASGSGWLASVKDEDIVEYLGYAANTNGSVQGNLGVLDVGNDDIVSFLDETGWDETLY